MPSPRVQQQIDRLLDEAEQAMADTDWEVVRKRCEAALALDPENEDARFYVEAADRAEGRTGDTAGDGAAPAHAVPASNEPAAAEPASRDASDITSFADGRYEVTKFLGEGGRKIVYLAKDTLLDRDVAFALIKTEGLDESARERITREAQTMGRLGSHPNVVGVLDIGEHDAQPFVVIELLGGGDVEGLLEDAAGPLPLEQVLEIAKDSARGLEFIHSKSIIHRDMKPGNVWLTSDGVAKIGDYGLALSGDKTRLTVEGTMVGTVDYMPPEQALGGEMTPRSDLYSLGAMIYELVTGTVPFKGDRITEVISQHINTAPELPSLRGAKIPPALEELILRLMAKDPDDRPESAAEVLQLLDTIDPNDTSQLDADYLAQLAQGVFVGRSRELTELKERFNEAVSGISRLVVLVGQPGIGKTRLARELETHARMRGARIYWGRAPEGGGAPPYWLFHQLLRRFLEANDELAARRDLGDEAPVLARIAPEIATQLAGVAVDEDANEFAIHEAMRTFLNRLSREAPLLVVLDDLHWADGESLAVMQHISRDLEPTPLMLLGTYRDTETNRGDPLFEALATFNREPSFARLQVRGLDREGVGEFIQRGAGFEPTREQLDLFMRQTDGNPFFLSETVAEMLEAGTLDERTYALTTPEGVREALSRRVNELPEDAVELLKLAAIAGYDFDFATLSIISDFEDDRQVELIELALAERVIAEDGRPGRYQFVYQPMQELLLDEMSSTRRLRLHGTIAEQLEQSFGARAQDHAAELARHYAESAVLNAAHVEPALKYSLAAAASFEEAGEWVGAERVYSRALSAVSPIAADNDASVADLSIGLGRVELKLGLFGSGIARFEGLLTDAESGHDSGRVVHGLIDGLLSSVYPRMTLDLAERALPLVAGRDVESEARLLAWIATGRGNDERSEEAATRAASIAARSDLRDVQEMLAMREVALADFVGDFERSEDALGGMSELPDARYISAQSSVRLAVHLLYRGDLSAAERALEEVVNTYSAEPVTVGFCQERLGSIHLMRWDRSALESLRELPGRPRGSFDQICVPRQREIEGDVLSALALESRAFGRELGRAVYQGIASTAVATARARMYLAVGYESAAREAYSIGDVEYFPQVLGWATARADEAFTKFASPETIRTLLDRAAAAEAVQPIRATDHGSFDRTRATWAVALGEFEEAERLARAGLEWTRREHCPVEEGRCHQLLADLLERRGEAREAAVHLDAAGDLFSEHGARLYLDQVLEKKDLLKA